MHTKKPTRKRWLLNFKTPFKWYFYCTDFVQLPLIAASGEAELKKTHRCQKASQIESAGRRGLCVVEELGAKERDWQKSSVKRRPELDRALQGECWWLDCRKYPARGWERKRKALWTKVQSWNDDRKEISSSISQHLGKKPHSAVQWIFPTWKIRHLTGQKVEKRSMI